MPHCAIPGWNHVVFLLLTLGSSLNLSATHIRSADLKVARTANPLEFKFTLVIYSNTSSSTPPGIGGRIHFGDGNSVYIGVQPVTLRPDLGEQIGVSTYTVNYTYAAHGFYQVSYIEGDRSAGIINMHNAGDQRYMSYISFSTHYMADNSLPILDLVPLDKSCRFNTFTHNAGAHDPDGDLLKYRIVIPRGEFTEISSYKHPNDPVFYGNFNTGNEAGTGPPTFTIDEDNGTITWDAPDMAGEYNIAFEIAEYRLDATTEQLVLVSTTVRDMQVVVEDCGNLRPTQNVPSNVCVVAGIQLDKTIKGFDHEKGLVKMEAISDIFNFPPEVASATLSPSPPDYRLADPYDSVNFSWKTECGHVRARPYQVVFRISDKPAHDVSLVTLNTWNITVMAPPPQWRNSVLDLGERHAKLRWESYACENADKIQIWRRVGSYPYNQSTCATGMPKHLGYDLVAEVAPTDTVFIDTNSGRRLVDGAQYCYRLVAVFYQATKTYSKMSTEFCFDPIGTDAPVITHVTVEKTSPNEGKVRVSWRSPFAINAAQFPKPYQYHVFRATGFSGSKSIDEVKVLLNDTTFVDSGINTLDSIFNYRIVIFSVPQGETDFFPVDTSGVASTERLSLTPGDKKITLAWRDSVPWSNVAFQNPWHVIYRGTQGEMDDELQKYDSIQAGVDSLYFIDDNLQENVLYHYRVMVRGTYGNPAIPLQENHSQTAFAYPITTLLPCKPVINVVGQDCDEFLATNNCKQTSFDNTIYWHADASNGCRKDIVKFNIYSSDTPDGEFKLIATTTDTLYKDIHLPSFARCYRVTAIDQSGNESEPGDVKCNDNCTHFELPNVFTPNGDGYNDLFSAYYDSIPNPPDIVEFNPTRCPRFVRAVDFYVYNRWGEELYHYQSGAGKPIYINWDGKGSGKTELDSGIYYYAVWVTFDTLDPSRRKKKYKGWIHLIR